MFDNKCWREASQLQGLKAGGDLKMLRKFNYKAKKKASKQQGLKASGNLEMFCLSLIISVKEKQV